MEKNNERREILRQLLSIGVPIALQNLISIGVSFVDTLMVGQLGEVKLGGVNQANQPYFFFAMIVFGLSIGTVVISARHWGKRELEPMRVITGLAMRLCIILGVIVSAVVLLFPERVMRIFAEDPAVIEQGVNYLKIIGWTYPITAFTGSYLVSLRACGDVRVSMWIYTISCLMNVFLNWMFIFGNLGAPRMEVAGAALATAICRLSEAVMAFIYMNFMEHGMKFRIKYIFSSAKEYWKPMARFGLPVLLSESIWGVGMTVQSAIIGNLGVSALAAYSVIYVIQDLATVLMVGFVNGEMIILSNFIGTGEEEHARKLSGTFNMVGVVFGVFMALVILLLRPFAPSFIVCSTETAEMIKSMMYVSAGLMFFLAISWNISSGPLRAGGDTRYCAVVDTTAFFVFKVVIGNIAAFVLKLEPVTVYLILSSDEFFKAIAFYVKYARGNWMHHKLGEKTEPEE